MGLKTFFFFFWIFVCFYIKMHMILFFKSIYKYTLGPAQISPWKLENSVILQRFWWRHHPDTWTRIIFGFLETTYDILGLDEVSFHLFIWLSIPLNCLWAKSNNRTRGQFEVTWFWFWFDFARSRASYNCCSIACLRFQVVQLKQVDCKMSTKNITIFCFQGVEKWCIGNEWVKSISCLFLLAINLFFFWLFILY